MSAEELERYETEIELQLYHEYKSVLPLFKFVVETERRFYLANEVNRVSSPDAAVMEYELCDAWVWDMYRQSRFVARAVVASTRAITIEELPPKEM